MHLAILTSGGDAPGMNAAIRAATRCALARGWRVSGVKRGYAGLLAGEFIPLDSRAVAGILQRGGSMLGSARCPDMHGPGGSDRAVAACKQAGVDALLVIGGNGSQAGALALAGAGLRVAGVGSTIDNDLPGAEMTIGADTALNVALEAVDRLKTTAAAHRRAFLVEVMGRDCGYLALMTALAGGAEAVVLPEFPTTPDAVARKLLDAWARGNDHALVVVAEGAEWNAGKLLGWFSEHEQRLGFELRATVLGHVQRGAAPGAFDRILATRLAAHAVDRLAAGEQAFVAVWNRGPVELPLAAVLAGERQLDPALLDLADRLAR